MPTNVEIKARVPDAEAIHARVRAIADGPGETLVQRDVFFACTTGRLKLRQIATGRCELIWYRRSDTAGSKRSDYTVMPVEDAASLLGLLDQALGQTRVVDKTRHLFVVGQTRVHLDAVVGLGDFVELEVVLREGQSEAEGHAIAADLMSRLGIEETSLLHGAYADMLSDET